MASKQTVEDLLSGLEARVVYHREQEAVHAERRAFHAQQEALHKAELEKALQSLEGFRAVLTSTTELAPVPSKANDVPLPPPNRKMVGRLVMLAVGGPELQEPFGPSDAAEETNRRFKDHLRKPVGSRTASDVLRRMLAGGGLELVRKGTANRETLYKRPRQGGSG